MNIILPDNLLPRDVLGTIFPFLEEENIILLTGARQTGKTSLLYLLIKRLLGNNLPSSQIVYFDFENIHDFNLINDLTDFNDFWKILKDKGIDPAERVYVFIDEIQHLSHPSAFLKYLHDHNKPKLKFIVTGSSSLEIKKKFTDRLTGRVYHFLVKPLSFHEYLQFQKKEDLLELIKIFNISFWISEAHPEKVFNRLSAVTKQHLNELIYDYLIYGGYPAVTLKQNPEVRQRDLQEIYSLYVRRDIKDLGDIADITGYNKLVSMLALQIGNLINEHELALSSGLSRPTIKKYLFLLENTFVVRQLPPFFTNKRTEIIKTSKVYFEDVGLRNGALNNFSPLNGRTDNGSILENFVFSQLDKLDFHANQLRYWRNQMKSEVDFIWQENFNEPYPLEVKFNSVVKHAVPSGLRSFIGTYQPTKAFIVHLGEFYMRKLKNTIIYAVPVWSI